jgi:hypothetical protein
MIESQMPGCHRNIPRSGGTSFLALMRTISQEGAEWFRREQGQFVDCVRVGREVPRASCQAHAPRYIAPIFLRRRGGRVAEGARLESVYTGNRIVGSNPTPSANPVVRICSRTFANAL